MTAFYRFGPAGGRIFTVWTVDHNYRPVRMRAKVKWRHSLQNQYRPTESNVQTFQMQSSQNFWLLAHTQYRSDFRSTAQHFAIRRLERGLGPEYKLHYRPFRNKWCVYGVRLGNIPTHTYKRVSNPHVLAITRGNHPPSSNTHTNHFYL